MNIEKMLKLYLLDKPPREWLLFFPYTAEIRDQVYDTLMGNLIRECRLPWVETIFVPGHPCYEEYSHMRDAYDRLLERLGEVDEDAEVEIIVDSLLNHGKIAAMEMFEYGRRYERMQIEQQAVENR